MEKIRAVWHSDTNYGDALTPYIIRHLYGKKPKHAESTDQDPTYMVTGSILGDYISNSIIWGPGVMQNKAILPDKYPPPTKNFDIVAVRGPISFQKCVDAGYTPQCYGDPALILPRIYRPKRILKHKIGLIPSWVEYSEVSKVYVDKDIHIVDVTRPIEKVIDDIISCEVILASALHGLITSVAYHIPTKWVQFSDRIVGDGTKYRDFLGSIKLNYEPVDLRRSKTVTKLMHEPFEHRLDIDLQKLWDVCPFRRTQTSSSGAEAPEIAQ